MTDLKLVRDIVPLLLLCMTSLLAEYKQETKCLTSNSSGTLSHCSSSFIFCMTSLLAEYINKERRMTDLKLVRDIVPLLLLLHLLYDEAVGTLRQPPELLHVAVRPVQGRLHSSHCLLRASFSMFILCISVKIFFCLQEK